MIVEVVGSYILKRYFEAKRETEDYIGEPNNKITFLSFMRDLLSFLLLYNYLIPISLYVTIELQKFIGK